MLFNGNAWWKAFVLQIVKMHDLKWPYGGSNQYFTYTFDFFFYLLIDNNNPFILGGSSLFIFKDKFVLRLLNIYYLLYDIILDFFFFLV